MDMNTLAIGLLTASVNIPGGAEFVSLSMLEALKEHGFKVLYLSNENMDHSKIRKYYGTTVSVDEEIILPDFFTPYDMYGFMCAS